MNDSPTWLRDFLSRERLPDHYERVFRDVLPPLAAWLHGRTQPDRPLLVGMNGAQGTGKSTLAKGLSLVLENTFECPAIPLSLDDFYLTRVERLQLADRVHPLLATRGVPGTHDIAMATDTLKRLGHASPQRPVALPRFDKSRDDRAPDSEWPVVQRRPAIILLEGWCVGTPPQEESALSEPVNRMEAERDTNMHWRRFVNRQLRDVYQPLFRALDRLIMLEAPSFSAVYQWRCLQEDRLSEQIDSHGTAAGHRLMDPGGIRGFLQHFERLTRHAFRTVPDIADVVLHMDPSHRITHASPPLTRLPHRDGYGP
ncbi:MAG: hypothetical protein ACQETO_02990 [Pseudomonadota bacterium]